MRFPADFKEGEGVCDFNPPSIVGGPFFIQMPRPYVSKKFQKIFYRVFARTGLVLYHCDMENKRTGLEVSKREWRSGFLGYKNRVTGRLTSINWEKLVKYLGKKQRRGVV